MHLEDCIQQWYTETSIYLGFLFSEGLHLFDINLNIPEDKALNIF